jgi:cell division transport system permease protein
MIKALKVIWARFSHESQSALLPADSRQVRPLTIVVAIMCALGCLAGLGASAGFRAASTWTSDLKSAMSIIVQSPRGDEDLERAAQIVGRIEGVTRSETMSRDRAKELLRNYGTDMSTTLDALPVPRLIEVGVMAGQTSVKADIEEELTAAGFKVVVDDHSRFTGEILRTSTMVRILAMLALLALVVAALATIAFAARAALETRRDAVSILHLVGAKDAFVAREVQKRFLRLGFVAGLWGANAAAIIALIALTVFAFGASDFTSGSPLLSWTDLWILLVAPFVTAFASAWAAEVAARATLQELV